MKVRTYALRSKTPPADIQLWNVGENPTDYGVHLWTDRSVASVGATYNERGNPLQIDVEHNWERNATDAPQPTGGYARLELRNGAPFLAFDWSDYAIAQIASGERLFLSPEYDVDPDTREIVRLYRVSLVADPGTHHARMLATVRAVRQFERVLASAERVRAERNEAMDLNVILAAIRAALAAEDPAVTKESLTNLLAELEKTMPGDDAPASDPAPAPDMAAAAPDPKPPFAAAAVDDPKPPTMASASPTKADRIAAAALAEIDGLKRDMLLKDEGSRLTESQRVWASSQPFATVKGLISASPKAADAPVRASGTRGAGQGDGSGEGLNGIDAENLDRAMGIIKASSMMPSVDAHNNIRLSAIAPSVYRKAKAEARKGG